MTFPINSAVSPFSAHVPPAPQRFDSSWNRASTPQPTPSSRQHPNPSNAQASGSDIFQPSGADQDMNASSLEDIVSEYVKNDMKGTQDIGNLVNSGFNDAVQDYLDAFKEISSTLSGS